MIWSEQEVSRPREEVGDGEEHLEHAVHVAAVAQIRDADTLRPIQRRRRTPRLLTTRKRNARSQTQTDTMHHTRHTTHADTRCTNTLLDASETFLSNGNHFSIEV